MTETQGIQSTTVSIAGRVAQAGAIAFVLLVASLHVLRPDRAPLNDPLSAYALGEGGALMTAAFLAIAVSFAALAVGVARNGSVARGPRVAPAILLSIACAGMLVAAITPTKANNACSGERRVDVGSIIDLVCSRLPKGAGRTVR